MAPSRVFCSPRYSCRERLVIKSPPNSPPGDRCHDYAEPLTNTCHLDRCSRRAHVVLARTPDRVDKRYSSDAAPGGDVRNRIFLRISMVADDGRLAVPSTPATAPALSGLRYRRTVRLSRLVLRGPVARAGGAGQPHRLP